MPAKLHSKTVTINGTTSAAFTILGEFALVGLVFPAGWTTANLTFQVSHDEITDAGAIPAGATYTDLYDDSGNAVTVTGAAASRTVTLGWNVYMPGTSFKIISSASQTSQTIRILFRA